MVVETKSKGLPATIFLFGTIATGCTASADLPFQNHNPILLPLKKMFKKNNGAKSSVAKYLKWIAVSDKYYYLDTVGRGLL